MSANADQIKTMLMYEEQRFVHNKTTARLDSKELKAADVD